MACPYLLTIVLDDPPHCSYTKRYQQPYER